MLQKLFRAWAHFLIWRNMYPNYWLMFSFRSSRSVTGEIHQANRAYKKKNTEGCWYWELMWRQSLWASRWGPCYGWVNTFPVSSAVAGKLQLYFRKFGSRAEKLNKILAAFVYQNCKPAIFLCASWEAHSRSFIALWHMFLHGLGSSPTLKMHQLEPSLTLWYFCKRQMTISELEVEIYIFFFY